MELVTTENEGRYWKAAKDYVRGDIVYSAPALIIAFADRETLERSCSYCCLDERPVRACSECNSVYYCSPACQRQHWRAIHKLECRYLNQIAPARPVGRLLAIARMVLLFKDPNDANIAAMCHHADKARLSVDSIDAMPLQVICNWLGCPPSLVLRMYSAFFTSKVIQSDTRVDETDVPDSFGRSGNGTGTGDFVVDPVLALFNHSCAANAYVTFQGNYASVQLLSNVTAGSVVSVAYISERLPFELRQDLLMQSYHFRCECARCNKYPLHINEFDLDIEYYHCCGKPLCPRSAITQVCPLCHKQLDAAACKALEAAVKEALSQPETSLELTLDLIRQLRRKGHWSAQSHFLHDLHMQACQNLMRQGCLGSVLDHMLMMLPPMPIKHVLPLHQLFDLYLAHDHAIECLLKGEAQLKSSLMTGIDWLTMIQFVSYLDSRLMQEGSLLFANKDLSKRREKLLCINLSARRGHTSRAPRPRILTDPEKTSEQDYISSLSECFAQLAENKRRWI